MAKKKETEKEVVKVAKSLKPLHSDVMYKAFIKGINKTKTQIAKYCNGELSNEQMQELEIELKIKNK